MHWSTVKEKFTVHGYWEMLLNEVTNKDVFHKVYLSNISHSSFKNEEEEDKSSETIINFGTYELTQREMQIAYLSLLEMTSKEVANEINISHRTVESYLESIKNKTNSRTKKQLIEKLRCSNFLTIYTNLENYGALKGNEQDE